MNRNCEQCNLSPITAITFLNKVYVFFVISLIRLYQDNGGYCLELENMTNRNKLRV